MKPKPLVELKNFTVPVWAMGSSCFPDDEPHLRDMHRLAGGREFTLSGKGRPKRSSLRVSKCPNDTLIA
jgi:hypothetical protein